MHLAGHDLLADAGPCPFLGSSNQLLRGYAVTRALARLRGRADAAFVVVHDARNGTLLEAERPIPGYPPPPDGPLARFASLLGPAHAARFAAIDVQSIARAYVEASGNARPPWLGAMCQRYRWDVEPEVAP